MSAGNDRSLPGSRNLLVVAVVLALLAFAGVVFWWRMSALRAVPAPAGTQAPPAPAGAADVPVSVTVYLPAGDALAASSAQIKRRADAQSQARELSLALLAEDLQGKGTVLTNVKLRELYLDASGIAYVDLAVVPKEGIRSSAGDELLAVYALVNTLTQNVEEIKGVRFLLEGKEAQTLAGHIDITRTYTKRTDLVKQ